MNINSEQIPRYEAAAATRVFQNDEQIIQAAIEILESRINQKPALTSPEATADYLRLKFASLEYEVFSVMWLDNRHRIIELEEMFRGTVNAASVHVREAAKSALTHNASACILVHNHPAGSPEPSQADLNITGRLKDALALVDVRTLDHMIVGTEGWVSLANRNLL